MHARIGVMRALDRHVEHVFNPDRKDHHWARCKLKRYLWPQLSSDIRPAPPAQ